MYVVDSENIKMNKKSVFLAPNIISVLILLGCTNGIGVGSDRSRYNVEDINTKNEIIERPLHLAGRFLNPLTAMANTYSVTLGDVDGDGDLDLVAGNDYGQTNRLYLNDGAGGLVDSGQGLGSEYSTSIVLGDLDGDSDLDLVTGNYLGQANRIFVNDGNGVFRDSGQALGSYDTTAILLGDMDADGDLDIIEGSLQKNSSVFE